MTATIKALCVGMPKIVNDNGREVLTGIWKHATDDQVRVHATDGWHR